MRRPIINQSTNQKMTLNLAPSKTANRTLELTGIALERRLRQKRSPQFIKSMTKLDTSGVTCSQHQIEELKQAIQSEFPDLSPSQFLIGIVAKCYLGSPYILHSLDMNLDIVKHFKKGETLPESMERARNLALHPSYEFIEVYSDTLRAVSSNGDVAVIKG